MTEEKEWAVYSSMEPIIEGDPYQVRETIEEYLEERLGFFVMLEHHDDDEDEEGNPVYQLFLHSDNFEDRTEEELIRLDELGMNPDAPIEQNHEAICRLLGIHSIQEKR